jgi:peroxin-13
MATHSSFFAMVGVADQLGSLKTYLGQVLGVFSILRLGRRILNWLRGKKVDTRGWANEWSSAAGGPPGVGPEGARPSSKPLILFLLSAVGLPWLMSRLVKLMIARTQQQQQQLVDGSGQLDPSKLTFARARWEFKPSEEWELALGRDEIVAVLEMREGKGGEAGWWQGRTRDGRIGWFPGNYVSCSYHGTLLVMSTTSPVCSCVSGRRDSEERYARERGICRTALMSPACDNLDPSPRRPSASRVT